MLHFCKDFEKNNKHFARWIHLFQNNSPKQRREKQSFPSNFLRCPKIVFKMEAPYLFHASQDTRRLVKGLRCCSCLIFSLLCEKYEVGKKGVVIWLVVLGQKWY